MPLMSTAIAFMSFPGGPHDRITYQAARQAGWPRHAMGRLLRAVRRPDLREFGWRPRKGRLLRIDATSSYRPRHHADRVPPMEDAAAWSATTDYVRTQRLAALSARRDRAAVAALGRALHAAQDVFSHSNHAELAPAQREAAVEALWHGRPAPSGLHLTAFEPGAARPLDPADGFPHAGHAKDAPDHNAAARREVAGGTAYEVAREGATVISRRILDDFLAVRGPPRRAWAGPLVGVATALAAVAALLGRPKR